ncbi:MAG: SsrA-binding protein SmpB [Candidatus Brocadiia bacterium]
MNSPIKIILKNRKAYFNYEIIDKYEAGLVLLGMEVKSLRDGKASINEAFARPSDGELFIYQMDITAYSSARTEGYQPKRPRKLLMHKKEIARLIGRIMEKGLTLVPLALYFKNGIAKLELGLARGKKLYDKREDIKKKTINRDIQKAMKR